MQAYVHTITTAAIMVAPPRNLLDAMPWSARTYVQGEIVRNSNRSLFWVVVAGASLVEPTVTGGAITAEANGGTVWQHIMPGPRKTFNAVNTGATIISIAIGSAPTAGVGSTVLQTNGTFNITAPNNIQDAIYAISSAGGGTLSVQDI